MTITKTNYTVCYTVCYTAESHIDSTLLQEECRILTGSWAGNVNFHDDPADTTFTISDSVEDGIDKESYFDQIAVDLSRYLGVKVTRNEIIIDD
jgi:hypothetical protein